MNRHHIKYIIIIRYIWYDVYLFRVNFLIEFKYIYVEYFYLILTTIFQTSMNRGQIKNASGTVMLRLIHTKETFIRFLRRTAVFRWFREMNSEQTKIVKQWKSIKWTNWGESGVYSYSFNTAQDWRYYIYISK